MPPAANESQGLKIAVAAFVSLTVILAVLSYFMYSNYSQASARLAKAEADARTAQTATSNALSQYQSLRDAIGYNTIEEYEAVQAAMKKDNEALAGAVADIVREIGDAVTKAQQGGENDPKFEELRASAQTLVAQYAAEPNKTYKDSLIRMKDLMRNLASLTYSFALSDAALRRSLVDANKVNAERLAQETQGYTKSKEDLEAEHVQHEKERSRLMAAVDDAQTRLNELSTNLAQLQAKYDRDTEKSRRDYARLQGINRQLQEQADKTDVVLDRPDGKVLAVDYSRNEVRVDLGRGTGAQPQMKLSIFDSSSPGLPTETPKGRIELISVGDRDAVARIEANSTEPLRPIRAGDLVYSAAWSPNEPKKFALIGKIDINRDGKDDRGDLIRMIEARGGVVEYDLPPPDADPAPGKKAVARAYRSRGESPPASTGRAAGELNSLFAWYVVDDRGAYYKNDKTDAVPTAEDAEFLKAVSEARSVARDNGVRPLPIDRLLAYMGYSSYNRVPVQGRAEYSNPSAIKGLLQPKGNTGAQTPPAPSQGDDPDAQP